MSLNSCHRFLNEATIKGSPKNALSLKALVRVSSPTHVVFAETHISEIYHIEKKS